MNWTSFLVSACVFAALWACLLTATKISTDDRFLLGAGLAIATFIWTRKYRKFSGVFFRLVSAGALLTAMLLGGIAFANNDGAVGWLAGYCLVATLLASFLSKIADDTQSPATQVIAPDTRAPTNDNGPPRPVVAKPQPRRRVMKQVLVTCSTCGGSALYGDCSTCNNVRWWYEYRYVDE